jgi:hypothetical protein
MVAGMGDEVWTDHERVASLLPELRRAFEKSCNRATQKGRTDATHPRFHPLYETSKGEITKQQAAANPETETKTPECVIADGRKQEAAAPRKSARHATWCSPPRIDGGDAGAVAMPAGDGSEGNAELRDLLTQYCVRHRLDQVQQLIAAGRANYLTIAGIIGFVMEKLKDKRNQNDPVYSVRLLIKAISDPADLNHWARRTRRSPSFFDEDRGASAVNAGNVASDVRSYLSGRAKQLRQIGSYEEIAAEIDRIISNANAQSDLEQLEQWLSDLEKRMTELTQSRLSAEEISQIHVEINANLARFRATMTEAQIDLLNISTIRSCCSSELACRGSACFTLGTSLSRAA